MNEKLKEIQTLMMGGRAPKVKEAIEVALAEGMDAKTILEEGLLAAMSIVGEKFKNNEVFVPEVLIAARAMNAGVEVLKPHMAEGEGMNKGTVVIGTVKGDMHDIGKNLVKMMLEGKGLNVTDLGVNVDADLFIEKAKELDADIICLSALLSTTMPEMKVVVDKVKEAGLTAKVMIGGAPVNQAFCDQIGADCYTPDAASCSEEALKFCVGA